MEISGQLYAPTALPHEKMLHQLKRSWIGSRNGLDILEKRNFFSLYRDSNPESYST
jgi:hypothetical protein